MRLVAAPVVRVAFADHAHAGLIVFQRVGPCSDGFGGVVKATIGLDHQVVIRHQIRQVGVAYAQCHFEHIAIGAHTFDALHDAQGAGLGIRVRVARHGLHDVLGRHRFAIREFNALADLEAPCLCVGRAFPAFRDKSRQGAVGFHLDETFTPQLTASDRHIGGPGRWVLAVGGFATLHTHFEAATRDRSGLGPR